MTKTQDLFDKHPLPWSVRDLNDGRYVLNDTNGHPLRADSYSKKDRDWWLFICQLANQQPAAERLWRAAVTIADDAKQFIANSFIRKQDEKRRDFEELRAAITAAATKDGGRNRRP